MPYRVTAVMAALAKTEVNPPVRRITLQMATSQDLSVTTRRSLRRMGSQAPIRNK